MKAFSRVLLSLMDMKVGSVESSYRDAASCSQRRLVVTRKTATHETSSDESEECGTCQLHWRLPVELERRRSKGVTHGYNGSVGRQQCFDASLKS